MRYIGSDGSSLCACFRCGVWMLQNSAVCCVSVLFGFACVIIYGLIFRKNGDKMKDEMIDCVMKR